MTYINLLKQDDILKRNQDMFYVLHIYQEALHLATYHVGHVPWWMFTVIMTDRRGSLTRDTERRVEQDSLKYLGIQQTYQGKLDLIVLMIIMIIRYTNPLTYVLCVNPQFDIHLLQGGK